ncbi:MAG: cation:proton antiporter [Bacteroidetes bacterium]|nr:MAG: cation:proton antiporter [Bacteroidota bacterium]
MQQLSHHELIVFFLQLSIMLLVGKIMGELAKKLQQPAVVGEILAGICLGPTLLGAFSPQVYQYLFPSVGSSPVVLHGLTTLSVILLLLISGLEVELALVFRLGKRAFFTSIMGGVIPFGIGVLSFLLFPSFFNVPEKHEFVFMLFLGTALAISALPVIARTLLDLGIFKSALGMMIIASAMIDDFAGWIIFSVILGLMKHEGSQNSWIFTFFAALTFAGVMITIGRRALDKLLPWINQHVSFPGGILSFAITLAFLGAAFTEAIGIHAVFGAFIVGVSLGDSIHFSKRTKEIIHDFVTNIFAPLFFVSIGLKINFADNFQLPLVLLVIVIAFVGKVVGAGLGAYLNGFSWRESAAVGFGLNARGAMEIILATLALQAGVIDKPMFVALVVMALVTSMTSGYLMKLVMPDLGTKNQEANGIIILGDNEISNFLMKFLHKNKVPILLTDIYKNRLMQSKPESGFSFQGEILEKGIVDRLDLSRYGRFLSLSDDEQVNLEAIKLFGYEIGEHKVYRLMSKQEAQSSQISLEENLLFSGKYWHYEALKKIINTNPEIHTRTFKDWKSIVDFTEITHNPKQIVPLFWQDIHQIIHPISSKDLENEKNITLFYINVSKKMIE